MFDLMPISDSLLSFLIELDTKIDNIAQHVVKPSSINQNRYLTKKEAADYLSASESTIDNYARRGELPKYKLGRVSRYKTEDLDKILKT